MKVTIIAIFEEIAQIIDSFIPIVNPKSVILPSILSQKPEILLNIWVMLYTAIE
jgi:hypothetical protein